MTELIMKEAEWGKSTETLVTTGNEARQNVEEVWINNKEPSNILALLLLYYSS